MDEIADVQNADNKACLEVYQSLIAAGNICSKIVENDSNIVRIFFHDLMRITTSYILKKNSLDESLVIPDWVIRYKKNKFPYMSYLDLLDGINIKEKEFNNYHNILSTKIKLIKYTCDLLAKVSPNRDLIGIGYGTPLGYKAYFRLLLDFNLSFLDHSRINIMRLNEQLSILNISLNDIFESKVDNGDLEKIKIIINNHLHQYIDISHNEIIYKKYNFIIIDSPGDPANRVNSVLAARNKIPVISFMHGAGDQAMYNEPRFGYSDSSFVDYIIGYGDVGIDYENSCYLRGFTKPPTFIGCSSSEISGIYKSTRIKKVKKILVHKWMYAPDSGQLINHHGPYAGLINTFVYFKWQKNLIKYFPGILYKKHPKGDPLFRQISDEQLIDLMGINGKDIDIITDDFKYAYKNCDGFIFDTVSTAFMIAAATNKPIIFFNIGKRKFTEYAEKKIKERCLWVDIINGDLIDMGKISKLLSTEQFINNITNKYSLTEGSNKTNEDALFSIIQKNNLSL